MPYNADLRCSYASVEINTAWLYTLFNDYGVTEPVFKETYMSTVFETEADKWASDYVKAKVFWTGKPPKDDPDYKRIMACDSVWEYIWEEATDWLDEHKDWLEEGSYENEDDESEPEMVTVFREDFNPDKEVDACLGHL